MPSVARTPAEIKPLNSTLPAGSQKARSPALHACPDVLLLLLGRRAIVRAEPIDLLVDPQLVRVGCSATRTAVACESPRGASPRTRHKSSSTLTRVAATSLAWLASLNSHAVNPHPTTTTTNNAVATTHQLSATRGRSRSRRWSGRSHDQLPTPISPSATISDAIHPARDASHAPTVDQSTHPAAAITQHSNPARPATSGTSTRGDTSLFSTLLPAADQPNDVTRSDRGSPGSGKRI